MRPARHFEFETPALDEQFSLITLHLESTPLD
jgi:hypothetical protein